MAQRGITKSSRSNVQRNLNRQLKGILTRTRRGLTKAGLVVERDAQKHTPVDTANLKSSAYVVSGTGRGLGYGDGDGTFTNAPGRKDAARMASEHAATIAEQEGAHRRLETRKILSATIGYTAFYGVFVHEDLEANHAKFDKATGTIVQVGTAKFLEIALRENQTKVLDILRKEASL